MSTCLLPRLALRLDDLLVRFRIRRVASVHMGEVEEILRQHARRAGLILTDLGLPHDAERPHLKVAISQPGLRLAPRAFVALKHAPLSIRLNGAFDQEIAPGIALNIEHDLGSRFGRKGLAMIGNALCDAPMVIEIPAPSNHERLAARAAQKN